MSLTSRLTKDIDYSAVHDHNHQTFYQLTVKQAERPQHIKCAKEV